VSTQYAASGWMIGVMVELAGETKPIRHFFAVGHPERAKAEWTAVDQALLVGPIPSSPVGGLEPVHVVSALTPRTLKIFALRAGEVRPLGSKAPRAWMRA
jgi:uncharacterized membrane protein